MARPHRLTIRLNDAELRSVRKFAEDKHVLPIAAVRWLLSSGLDLEDRGPPQRNTTLRSLG